MCLFVFSKCATSSSFSQRLFVLEIEHLRFSNYPGTWVNWSPFFSCLQNIVCLCCVVKDCKLSGKIMTWTFIHLALTEQRNLFLVVCHSIIRNTFLFLLPLFSQIFANYEFSFSSSIFRLIANKRNQKTWIGNWNQESFSLDCSCISIKIYIQMIISKHWNIQNSKTYKHETYAIFFYRTKSRTVFMGKNVKFCVLSQFQMRIPWHRLHDSDLLIYYKRKQTHTNYFKVV